MDPALRAVVAPTVLAAERTLPVLDAWSRLLPGGSLVRGRTIACEGLAAPSTALSLATAACRDGAWLAILDLPWLGVEAAAEHGIPIERLVRIDAGPADGSPGSDPRGELWSEALAAAIDGFDLILTRVPRRAPAGTIRQLRTRLRSRGGVLISVGAAEALVPDMVIGADVLRWEGVGAGHGHLQARRVTATVTGRRTDRTRRGDLWLPGTDGTTVEAAPEPIDLPVGSDRPGPRTTPVTVGASTPVPVGG